MTITAPGGLWAQRLKRPLNIKPIVGRSQSIVEKYLGKGTIQGDEVVYHVTGFFRVSASFYSPSVKPGQPMWDMSFVFDHNDDAIDLPHALAAVGIAQVERQKFKPMVGSELEYDHIVGAPIPWGANLIRWGARINEFKSQGQGHLTEQAFHQRLNSLEKNGFDGRTELLICMPDHP